MKDHYPHFHCCIASILLILLAAVPGPATGAQVEFTSSNLPVIIIDTGGLEIVDAPRISARMSAIDNGPGERNRITDPANDYDGRIAIELRGSATGGYPKRQYRFETQDEGGDNLNISLLGLPVENDWILYGPYTEDTSLIRNVLAYRLSRQIGRYASRTRLCEVVLNGDYRGLYVLMEKIKRDNDRIDIEAMDENDTSGDSLTGGYIIKLDKRAGENVGWWKSVLGTEYQYHEPKPDEITPEQKSYIEDFMDRFEAVMVSNDYSDPVKGYPAIIDIDSWIDHFILNEVCKNVDAYRISAFLHKNRDSVDSRLVAGPIWDFNLSFGQSWFLSDRYQTEGWQVDYYELHPGDRWQVPFTWVRLVREPNFVKRAVARWRELRSGALSMSRLFETIDLLADSVSEARVRNFERWPEAAPDPSYEAEIVRIKQWLEARLAWIDSNLAPLSDAGDPFVLQIPESPALAQNYPNPFNSGTIVVYSIPSRGHVRLEVFDLRGRLVDVLVDSYQTAGVKSAGWDGIGRSGVRAPSGTYLYRLAVDGEQRVKKMVLLQ